MLIGWNTESLSNEKGTLNKHAFLFEIIVDHQGWKKCKISLEYDMVKIASKIKMWIILEISELFVKNRQKYTYKWYISPQNCKYFTPKVKISREWDYQIPHFVHTL